MTDAKNTLTHEEIASKGGKARSSKLTPERRKEIAISGAFARHKKDLPKATHDGKLNFGDKVIDCWVIKNKDGTSTRVVSSVSVRTVLGLSNPDSEMRKKAQREQLPTFLTSNSLKPYLEEVFDGRGLLISFISKNGKKTEGIEARLLPKVCDAYLKARRDGLLNSHQEKIAIACEIIVSALAQVGITALVDEVTGFEEEKARNELQTLLKKFISEDLLKWTQRFPHQFFREIYRLYGWEYQEGKCRHASCLGVLINKYVYDAISPDVLQELKNKNPIISETGTRAHCHHQLLTPEVGLPALDRHLLQTIALLRASRTKEEFDDLFYRTFPKQNPI